MNELMLGGGQALTFTVANWLKLHDPFLLTAVSVYVVELDGETVRLPDAATGLPFRST